MLDMVQEKGSGAHLQKVVLVANRSPNLEATRGKLENQEAYPSHLNLVAILFPQRYTLDLHQGGPFLLKGSIALHIIPYLHLGGIHNEAYDHL